MRREVWQSEVKHGTASQSMVFQCKDRAIRLNRPIILSDFIPLS